MFSYAEINMKNSSDKGFLLPWNKDTSRQIHDISLCEMFPKVNF